MQSSSKELLQKVLQDKLRSWIDYINGEQFTNGKVRYRLSNLPGKVVVQRYIYKMPSGAGWVVDLIVMELKDNLEISFIPNHNFDSPDYSLSSNKVMISYADPEFYKRIFSTIADAIAS